MNKGFTFFIIFFLSFNFSTAQTEDKIPFLQASETLNKKRIWTMGGFGLALYTGSMIGLNELWYADFPRSKFHLFDDRGEWMDMDKAGHFYSAYNESLFFYKLGRWGGMNKKQAIWTGAGVGTIIQTSIEILDGHSEKWGFSLADIGFNTGGVALFAIQQAVWDEQKIIIKGSTYRKPYSDAPLTSIEGNVTSSIREHASNLFGDSYFEYFLKDYNAQTVWLSGNIHSILKLDKESRFPKWLNVAVGYGADNVFGGFGNGWIKDGERFRLSPDDYPRVRQYYLSVDIDLKRIPTKSRFLKMIFTAVNMWKIPAPALRYDDTGNWKLHAFHF